MKIAVTGGTGFVGGALCRALAGGGHSMIALTRSAPSQVAGVRLVQWDWHNGGSWEKALTDVEAVVNLAGEPIAQRWTTAKKREILESRVGATRGLVRAIQKCSPPPKVLISASAVGYYGPHREELLTEESPVGTDFLADVCRQWEAAAREAAALGVRVVCVRLGVVLGAGGGALARMLPFFRIGLGGPIGHGRQWMSWVHREDVIGLIRFAIENAAACGALNATAPNPVTNREFTLMLGAALHRPAILPVPPLALRLRFGEMADAVLVKGQRVIPAAARRLGYEFRFPELAKALKDIFHAN